MGRLPIRPITLSSCLLVVAMILESPSPVCAQASFPVTPVRPPERADVVAARALDRQLYVFEAEQQAQRAAQKSGLQLIKHGKGGSVEKGSTSRGGGGTWADSF